MTESSARKMPVVATVVVGLAVAIMIGLGVWQLQRAEWKESLLATYAAAAGKPPIAYPSPPSEAGAPFFRRSRVNCLAVVDWRAASGRNVDGQSGWVHVATCRTGGGEGPGAQVVVGWSTSADPPSWTGGVVPGVIAPDSRHVVRLVATDPPKGLQQVQPPSLDDVPNNHRGYAFQWFAFAAIAALIYALALRGRRRGGRAGQRSETPPDLPSH